MCSIFPLHTHDKEIRLKELQLAQKYNWSGCLLDLYNTYVRKGKTLRDLWTLDDFINHQKRSLKLTSIYLVSQEKEDEFNKKLEEIYNDFLDCNIRLYSFFGYTSKNVRKLLGLQENEQPKQLNFWILRGFSLEEATLLSRENVPGHSSYKDYIDMTDEEKIHKIRSMKPQCEEYYIDKDLDEEFELRRQYDISINNLNGRIFSFMSYRLFTEVLANIKEVNLLNNSYYGFTEKTLRIRSGFCKPDFLYKNKIIEFYGDYWHANPDNYGKDDNTYLCGKGLVKDIHEKDKNRIEEIKELGYEVLIIWEKEFLGNRESVINKCINFLIK